MRVRARARARARVRVRDPNLHLDRLLLDVLLEALADLAVLRVAIRVGAAGERALARHEAHHLGAQLRRRVLDEVAPG